MCGRTLSLQDTPRLIFCVLFEHSALFLLLQLLSLLLLLSESFDADTDDHADDRDCCDCNEDTVELTDCEYRSSDEQESDQYLPDADFSTELARHISGDTEHTPVVGPDGVKEDLVGFDRIVEGRPVQEVIEGLHELDRLEGADRWRKKGTDQGALMPSLPIV